ncbi:hypothetical protein BC830DRAFT_1084367 [Chytriomyces sp. MP71]|nr:hypothetical protein BC830DRAFT_1084367 [Chytriomyces sp. MP71]
MSASPSATTPPPSVSGPTSASPDSVPGTDEVSGFVFMPPGWDENRLRTGVEADAIAQIAHDTFTDIAYIKEKNAITIIGETHEDVYAAQTKLNDVFFPVIVRSKKQWARPDRPGNWGQRRDSVQPPAGSALRRMNSDASLRNNSQLNGNGVATHNSGWTAPVQGGAAQFQQPWLQQQAINNQQNNYYQHQQSELHQAYQKPQNRQLGHRNSHADFKRNSFNGYPNNLNEQPISPASPFARW